MFFIYCRVFSQELVSTSLKKPCGFFPWFLTRIPLTLFLVIFWVKESTIDVSNKNLSDQPAFLIVLITKPCLLFTTNCLDPNVSGDRVISHLSPIQESVLWLTQVASSSTLKLPPVHTRHLPSISNTPLSKTY